MKTTPIKRALLSVSDKTGLVEFARELEKLGVELISTGGTSEVLTEHKIPHMQVEDITGFPGMLDGRVKTLHPLIHGGILGRRDAHADEAKEHQIKWIDLVVVNFYPFSEATQHQDLSWEEAIEYIDVGGPTLARAAAKNFSWVTVITDPNDYASLVSEFKKTQGIPEQTRRLFAQKAFACTSAYEAMIHQFFQKKESRAEEAMALRIEIQLEKVSDLRYGENPHQHACAYQYKQPQPGILGAHQHQGKALSYNNIIDADAAWACVQEFTEPACVIIKHANPCGAASGDTIDRAFAKAYAADPTSAFGGIIALNRFCTKSVAEAMRQIFIEVVIAPAFSSEALALLAAKPNLRVLQMGNPGLSPWEMKFISGGVLCQKRDTQPLSVDELTVVTHLHPNAIHIEAMLFAWRVLKHVKSNAIVMAKENATIGIGAGQVSRIDAVDIALRKAGTDRQDTVLASDAFFPFRDSIDRLANSGVCSIIQPGGSVRDKEVIAACDEGGIAMVFTGKRCFKH